MILKLNNAEVHELRSVLLQVRAELLRGLSDSVCQGYSARNIALCARRSHLECILDRLDRAPEIVAIGETVRVKLLAESA